MQAFKILSGVFKGLTPIQLMVKLSRTCDQREAPSALLLGQNPGTHAREDWLGPRAGRHVFGDENFSD